VIIGIPKEMKVEEYRVGAPPNAVDMLTKAGHKVLVQATAGEGSGFADAEYTKVGATIIKTVEELYDRAEMIYQVKEPISSEYSLLKKDQIHFRYLHLCAIEELTRALIDKGVTAIAFETIETADGSLPCLDPMSAVAGRIATQVGAQFLARTHKGRGKLLGGVPGVPPATVVVLGGGVVGTNATKVALGLGARVIVVDINLARLSYLEDVLHGRLETLASNPYNIAQIVKEADLLIGAVLVRGERTPVLVTRDMVKSMKPGSVIVDVCIDQGGCVETSRLTTHADPTYIVDDVIHYCVSNMPGIFPRTAAVALSNATLPYALKIADMGWREAVKADEALRKGLNVWDGKVASKSVADSLGLEYTPFRP